MSLNQKQLKLKLQFVVVSCANWIKALPQNREEDKIMDINVFNETTYLGKVGLPNPKSITSL